MACDNCDKPEFVGLHNTIPNQSESEVSNIKLDSVLPDWKHVVCCENKLWARLCLEQGNGGKVFAETKI